MSGIESLLAYEGIISMTRVDASPPEVGSTTAPQSAIRVRGPVALYLLLVLAAYPFYRFLIGPDAISYISIAQHYARGEWSEAFNPYWSPLLSWLIAPLLALHVPGLLAAKIVCILSGLGALWSLARLVRVVGLSRLLGAALLYAAAVMLSSFALVWITPDLLSAAIVLYYFSVLFSPRYLDGRKAGLLCGLIGVIAYLSKAYNFYFFLAHFTIVSLILWARSRGPEHRRAFRHFAAGLIVFVIGCAPWIAIVTVRAHTLTVGDAGEWNLRLVGPNSPGFPQFYHLIPPSSPHALSMWENPSPSMLPRWNPFASVGNLRHEARLIATNLRGILEILNHASLFAFTALFAYFIWGLSRPTAGRSLWLLMLTSIAILPAGYVLVTLRDRYVWDDRYLWAGMFLVMLAAFLVLQAVGRGLSPLARNVAAVICALSFTATPLLDLLHKRTTGHEVYEAGLALKNKIPAGSRFASCGQWNDGIGIAYYLGAQFYGSTGITGEEKEFRSILNPKPNLTGVPKQLTPAEIAQSLRDYRINYFLILPDCSVKPAQDILTHPVEVPGRPDLKLYRVSD
jgi:hypothetical protein